MNQPANERAFLLAKPFTAVPEGMCRRSNTDMADEQAAVLEVKDAPVVPPINAEEIAGNTGDPQANANDGETKEEPKKLGGFQKKILRLEQEKETLLEALKRVGGEKPVATKTVEVEAVEPKEDDFATAGEYIKALRAFDKKENEKLVNKILADRDESKTKQTAEQQRMETFATRAKEFITETPDYEATMAKAAHLAVTPAMHEVITESEVGPALAYYLATHEDEAESIAAMNPAATGRALGKIEASLAKQSAPAVDEKPDPLPQTRAPKPAAPVTKTTASADNGELRDDLPPEEWARRFRRKIEKK